MDKKQIQEVEGFVSEICRNKIINNNRANGSRSENREASFYSKTDVLTSAVIYQMRKKKSRNQTYFKAE